jgi:hypothetical protein
VASRIGADLDFTKGRTVGADVTTGEGNGAEELGKNES